ncbi:MAG TPA: adenylate kinase [Fimbriimonadaceae bacterium]|nr:adenylate kinase [Fimbriimonadaceae bacterium]
MAGEPLRLILIGPPGVGKGTQAALLESRLGVQPMSSGVIFRSEIEAETDLGRMARRYIEHGELVPNGVTIEMMAKRLRTEAVRKHGFVLDGFPRTMRQAEALDEILDEMDLHLNKVVSLELPESVLMARLAGRLGCTKCGEIYHSVNKPPRRPGLCDKCNSPLFVRTDDQPEAILERLRSFHEETQSVCDYYEAKGLLQHVESDNPESVYHEIVNHLA